MTGEKNSQKLARLLKNRDALIVFGILMLAAVLRFYALGDAPLSLDESFTLKFTEYSWPELSSVIAAYDIHPPLSYAVSKFFVMFCDSPFFLRLPSVLLSLLTLPVIYGITANLFEPPDNRLIGHFSAILFTFSAIQLGAAQNARGYTLFVFAVALALYGCTSIIRNQDLYRTPAIRWLKQRDAVAGLAALTTGFALSIWAHHLGLLYSAVIGGICAGIFLFQSKPNIRAFAALSLSGVIALLIWSPNLAPLLDQFGGVSGDFWVHKPGLKEIIAITAGSFGVVDSSPFPRIAAGALSIPIFFIGLVGAILLWRRKMQWQAIFITLTITTTMVALILISVTIKPILLLRVTYPLSIPWIILVSYGAVHFRDGRAGRVFQILIVALFAHGAIFYALQQNRSEDWDRIVHTIVETSGEDAIVFTLPNSSAMPFDHQAQRQGYSLRALPIPAPFPTAKPEYTYPSGAVGVPGVNEAMLKDVESIIEQTQDKEHWIILHGYWIYDKNLIAKPMLDKYFCYAPMEIDSWYLLVYRLIPLSKAAPGDCVEIETRFFPAGETG